MTLLATNPLLAAVTTAGSSGTELLCKILFVGLVVSLIVGIASALGLADLAARVGGRFNALVVFIVLLVIYVVFC